MPAVGALSTTVNVTSITYDNGYGPVAYSDAYFPSSYYNAVHIDFNLSAGAPFSVRFGPDFGYGGSLAVDGVPVDVKSYDLWWGYDWNNTSQILSASMNLGAGPHTIDVVGNEGCCFGGQEANWNVADTGWRVFSLGSTLVRTAPASKEECKNGGWVGLRLQEPGRLRELLRHRR